MPAVGYDQPGPVALRLAPLLGGRRDRRPAALRLARPRDRPHRHAPTTRSRACRWAAASARRSPPRRMPVAAVDAPEDFGFWAPGAWGPPGDLAIPAFADVGRALAGSRDPAVAQAAKAAAFAGGVRAALAPLGNNGEPTYTPQRGLPAEQRGALPAPARRARGDARRRPAGPLRDAVGPGRVGHARRPGRHAAGQPQDHGRQPVRVPARPRGARDRRPRAHARVVGVRPPRRGERLRAPTTAPPASGSSSARAPAGA